MKINTSHAEIALEAALKDLTRLNGFWASNPKGKEEFIIDVSETIYNVEKALKEERKLLGK